MTKSGTVRVGIGGWTYAPWRGTFYPKGHPQSRELDYASRQLSSIEINGTYYSTFQPATWEKWAESTPDGFVFSVKASRFATNRKSLPEGAESIRVFLNQGLARLGSRLGPINWQLMPTKKFDASEIDAFLKLLPREIEGLPLRHALEVRHDSFNDPRFADLARQHNAAIVFVDSEDYPSIETETADFTYARLMRTKAKIKTGYTSAELDHWAGRAKQWSKRGAAFVYFISGAKERAPAAACALIERCGNSKTRKS